VNSGPDERPQPSGGRTPDEFDAIVALWAREGSVPQWPDEDARVRAEHAPDSTDATAADATDLAGSESDEAVEHDPVDEPPRPPAPPRTAAPLFGEGPRDHVVPPARPEDLHYVPPEPPPLPRLGPPAVVGLVLLALGLVLVLVPNWVGVGPAYGLPLGLLSLAAGLGWLVLRLWPDPPDALPPDEDDDGAVI
jgi:hypothetical protein